MVKALYSEIGVRVFELQLPWNIHLRTNTIGISTILPYPFIYGLNSTVVFWPSTRPKMPFQGDAPEGRDTF